MFAVTLAASIVLSSSWLSAQVAVPQYGRKTVADKGPRALGLVQLSPKGKARIIPIAIMMDGKFYDAGAYKADPVPMALDFGVVYEGFRAGVTQGVFTITQPGQLSHNWIAEGTWLPAGEKAPEKSKKYAAPVIEDSDAPPVLHRRSEKSDADSASDKASKDNADKDKGDKGKDTAKDKDKDDKDKSTNKDKSDKVDDKDQAKSASAPASASSSGAASRPDAAKPPAEAPKASASTADEPIADPNRPRLRRGKPDPAEHHEPFTTFDALTDAAPGAPSGKAGAKGKDSADVPAATLIPAISDAGGPDPRPYTYDIKPAEEAIYRNKMLQLATTQLLAQANAAAKTPAGPAKRTSTTTSKPAPAGKSATKPAQPAFDNPRIRIFDLSSSNEPVLVFSATTHPAATDSSAEPKEITLIARTDLEGELRKLFFSQTDSRHLDVTPRLELIDAVDADGDGRGELLFRRTTGEGSAYAIYRVSADHLWPLFEGTP